MADKIVIRPAIVATATTMEKRMQQVLDWKVNFRTQPDTTKFRKGIRAQTDAYLDLIQRFEDKGDPSVDIQQIQNKMADAMIMLLGALLILDDKQNANR